MPAAKAGNIAAESQVGMALIALQRPNDGAVWVKSAGDAVMKDFFYPSASPLVMSAIVLDQELGAEDNEDALHFYETAAERAKYLKQYDLENKIYKLSGVTGKQFREEIKQRLQAKEARDMAVGALLLYGLAIAGSGGVDQSGCIPGHVFFCNDPGAEGIVMNEILP